MTVTFKILNATLLIMAGAMPLWANSPREEDIVYKTTSDGEKLHILINYPSGWQPTDQRTAMLFFHGGGWTQGTYTAYKTQTAYFASRGIVMFRVQYRLLKPSELTIPAVCAQDARSAMRFVRANAARFGINPDRIVTSGGSAGGHLAASTAIKAGLDDPADDLSVSPKPQAMILMNPGLDLIMEAEKRGTSVGKKQMETVRLISPQQHLDKDTPPSVIFFGDRDPLLPHGTNFAKQASRVGVRADLHVYKGVGHTFWRRSVFEDEVVYVTDQFLASLGYLDGPPTIARPTEKDLLTGAALEQRRRTNAPDEEERLLDRIGKNKK
jgi:acetyl esterase